MKFDIIVAGVSGADVLATADILATAAIRSGYHALQSDHLRSGKSEESAVAHLRLSDGAIVNSDIGKQEADLIIALEPVEGLRHVELLSPSGALIASTEPVPNPPREMTIDDIHWAVLKMRAGFLVEATRMAREAGGVMAANVVMLGAAVDFLPIEAEELRAAIVSAFDDKGRRVVDVNLTAFEAGRETLRHREMVDEFDTLADLRH